MKSIKALFAFAAFAACGVAGAQTCSSPLTFPVDASGNPLPFYGDTCAVSNSIGVLCSGLIIAPEPDIVLQVTVSPPYVGTTITVTPTTPGFDVAVVGTATACGPTAACVSDADWNGRGGSEVLTDPGTGVKHIVITSSPESVTCGSFVATRSDF